METNFVFMHQRGDSYFKIENISVNGSP